MNRRGFFGLFAAAPFVAKAAASLPRPALTVNDVLLHVREILDHSANFPLADEMAARIGSTIRIRYPPDFKIVDRTRLL